MSVLTTFDKSTNKDTLKTLVKDWFNNTDRPPMVEWKEIMLDLKTSDQYERRGRWAGFTYPEEVPESEAIGAQDPKFDDTKDYTQVKYGTGFRISYEMKEFNKIGLMEKLSKNLRMVMEEGKDVEIAKMWNNTTATTYAAGYDGFAIAYDSHTCLDDAASTYDNKLGSALSTSTLESMRNYFDYLKDDQGNVITANPSHLVVNYSLVVTAEELLGSSQKPHEFSNTINYFNSADLKIFDYHRLSSTTAWFAIAKNDPNYEYFCYTSREPSIIVERAPDTSLDDQAIAFQLFKYGVGDPRLAYFGNA